MIDLDTSLRRASADDLDPLEALHRCFERRLADLFDGERGRWGSVDRSLIVPLDALRAFVERGGKRLRPAFCFLGWLGGLGETDDQHGIDDVIDLAVAIELLHTFALIHDDVMDGSDVRRHAPTVHEHFGAVHERSQWRGERRRFGEGMAILIGDLALVYSTSLLKCMPATVLDAFDEMRIELHMGQYLDMLSAADRVAGASRPGDLRRVEVVMRYKSGAYSVLRPLQLGLALAAGLEGVQRRQEELSRFGHAVGEAFQLRDDLLGALGDASVTGKPMGDDFREGKLTMLVLHAEQWARERGCARDVELLRAAGSSAIGDADIVELQEVLRRSGAVDAAEARIATLMETAASALDALEFPPTVMVALDALSRRCAWRAA